MKPTDFNTDSSNYKPNHGKVPHCTEDLEPIYHDCKSQKKSHCNCGKSPSYCKCKPEKKPTCTCGLPPSHCTCNSNNDYHKNYKDNEYYDMNQSHGDVTQNQAQEQEAEEEQKQGQSLGAQLQGQHGHEEIGDQISTPVLNPNLTTNQDPDQNSTATASPILTNNQDPDQNSTATASPILTNNQDPDQNSTATASPTQTTSQDPDQTATASPILTQDPTQNSNANSNPNLINNQDPNQNSNVSGTINPTVNANNTVGHGDQSQGRQTLNSNPNIQTPVDVSGVNVNVTVNCGCDKKKKDCCDEKKDSKCKIDCQEECRKTIESLLSFLKTISLVIDSPIIDFYYEGPTPQTTGTLLDVKQQTFMITADSGIITIPMNKFEAIEIDNDSSSLLFNFIETYIAKLTAETPTQPKEFHNPCYKEYRELLHQLKTYQLEEKEVTISVENAQFVGIIKLLNNNIIYLYNEDDEGGKKYFIIPVCKVTSLQENVSPLPVEPVQE